MTVTELIHALSTIDSKIPVLAYSTEVGGYVNASVEIVNEDGPKPYVVIK